VGNNRGGVDGVGNNRGGVDGVGNRDSLGVLGLTSVRDLSDVAINVVGVVGDGLDTAVRKVHLVGALNNTGAIVALSLAKGGLGVVVGNSVVVGVGGDLGKVIKRGSVCNSVDDRGSMDDRGSVDDRGGVDNGSGMDKRGSVDSVVGNRGSVDKRGSMGNSVVGNRVGDSGGSMDKRGSVGYSVVGNGVGNHWSSMGNWVGNVGSDGNNSSVSDGNGPVGSNGRLDLREALGVVGLGNGRVGGAKGLGLDKSPLLAMSSGD
jgi:hypothetical protein